MLNTFFKFSLLLLLVFSMSIFTSCGDDDEATPSETSKIIPGQGITEIKIGATGQEVFDAFGQTADSWFGVGGSFSHFLVYISEGMTFYLEQNDSETLDLTKAVTHLDIEAPYEGKTDNGIGIGSTMTEVKAAYGEPDEEKEVFGAIEATYNIGMVVEYDDQGNETVVKITIE